jgi:transposase InsO family protein
MQLRTREGFLTGNTPTHAVYSAGCELLNGSAMPICDFLEVVLDPLMIFIIHHDADIYTAFRHLYSRSSLNPVSQFYVLLADSALNDPCLGPYIPRLHLLDEFATGDAISIGDYPAFASPERLTLFSSMPLRHTPAALSLRPSRSLFEYQCAFEGLVEGRAASILLDTGSQISVVTKAFLLEFQIPFTQQVRAVAGLNNTSTPTFGTVDLNIQLHKRCTRFHFTVVECIPGNISVLLGLNFLVSINAITDFSRPGHVTITLGKGKHRDRFTRAFVPASDLPRCLFARNIESIEPDQPESDIYTSGNAVNKFLNYVKRNELPLFRAVIGRSDTTGPLPLSLALTLPEPSFLDAVIQKHVGKCLREEPPDGAHEKGYSFSIDLLPGAQPKAHRQFRLTPAEREELNSQVEKLIKKQWIQPSSSAWAAPVLFAPKPGGKLRLCIDYRSLNNATVKNSYPLPRIDDIFDALKSPKYFTALDLASGYHQFPVEPKDIPKTAFRTSNGLYEWKVMPFGLANAPAIFQNAMNSILAKHIAKGFCLVYLDDILIFSSCEKEHSKHVDLILTCLDEAQLFCQPAKCKWAQTSLKYLGHIITCDGIKVDPAKVAVVQDWPAPVDKGQLRAFLGLTNYFRKFIPHYATTSSSLTHLTRDVPFNWTQRCAEAFAALKACLLNAPTLAIPNEALVFQVYTDASITGVGGVLIQEGKPVAYCGRKLIPAEVNYSTTEQELLAIVYATQQWRHYLEGPTWELHTDHQPLVWIKTQPHLSRRQTRWLEWLSRFHIEYHYIPGKLNVLADALSRATHLRTSSDADLHDGLPPTVLVSQVVRSLDSEIPFWKRSWSSPICLVGGFTRNRQSIEAGVALPPPPKRANLQPLEREAPVSRPKRPRLADRVQTFDAIESVTAPTLESGPIAANDGLLDDEDVPESAPEVIEPLAALSLPQQSEIDHKRDLLVDNFFSEVAAGYLQDPWFSNPAHTSKLELTDGYYFRDKALVIPLHGHLRESILYMHHNAPWAGHLGWNRTVELIAKSYWWPGMSADVSDYVRSCNSCQLNKSKNLSGETLMAPLPAPSACWRTVGVDLIPSLCTTLTGFDSVCVFACHFSKMLRLIPTNTTLSSQGFAQLYIKEIFPHYGLPLEVVSDRGRQWNSAFWNELCKLCEIKQRMSSAYRPQTDGLVERNNRVVEEALRHYVSPSHDDWDIYLPFLEFALNNAKHEATGCSAFQLNRITQPLAPLQALLQLQSKIPASETFAVKTHLHYRFAHRLLHQAKNRMKQLADSKRTIRSFEPGSHVLLSTKYLKLCKSLSRKKFMPRFLGPLSVTERIGKNAYKLNLPASMQRIHDVFHVSLLFPYKQGTRMQVPPSATVEGMEHFEVDAIIDHRDVAGSREYLVTWLGYPSSDNSWEPESELFSAAEAVRAYQIRMNLPERPPKDTSSLA